MSNEHITLRHVQLRNGHQLQLFYNEKTDLLVVDVVAKNGAGGNEILRKHLNFDELLEHCDGIPE